MSSNFTDSLFFPYQFRKELWFNSSIGFAIFLRCGILGKKEWMKMYKVLVCDDDRAILDSVEIYLRTEGYEVLKASDGVEALELLRENEVQCVVLDVMMPRMDGLSAMLKMRDKYNFPIILLSAKSEDTDKIAGLSFGADDYVTKPYNPLELTARVKSQIRRYVSLGSMEKKDSVLTTRGLSLDRDTKAVLSSSQIYEAVWQEPSFGTEKTVTVHVRNIREKIEINPKDPKYLKVVWGLGYKVEKY